jgi:hypothetical protein
MNKSLQKTRKKYILKIILGTCPCFSSNNDSAAVALESTTRNPSNNSVFWAWVGSDPAATKLLVSRASQILSC